MFNLNFGRSAIVAERSVQTPSPCSFKPRFQCNVDGGESQKLEIIVLLVVQHLSTAKLNLPENRRETPSTEDYENTQLPITTTTRFFK